MRRLKVCFLTNLGMDSPTTFGRVFPLARSLARKHEVHFLMLDADFSGRTSFEQDGVKCQSVGQAHIKRRSGVKQYYSTWRLLAVSLRSTLALFRAALAVNADVYPVADTEGPGLVAD